METKHNIKIVTDNIMDAIEHFTYMGVDSVDKHSVIETPEKCTFGMAKHIDEKINGKTIRPIGMIVYTVTVEAKYIPHD